MAVEAGMLTDVPFVGVVAADQPPVKVKVVAVLLVTVAVAPSAVMVAPFHALGTKFWVVSVAVVAVYVAVVAEVNPVPDVGVTVKEPEAGNHDATVRVVAVLLVTTPCTVPAVNVVPT